MKPPRNPSEYKTLSFNLPIVGRTADIAALANRWTSRKCAAAGKRFQRSMPFSAGSDLTPFLTSLGRVFFVFDKNQPAVDELKASLFGMDIRALESGAYYIETVLGCFSCFFGVKKSIDELPALLEEGLAFLEQIHQTLDEFCPEYFTTIIGGAAMRDELALRELVRRVNEQSLSRAAYGQPQAPTRQ